LSEVWLLNFLRYGMVCACKTISIHYITIKYTTRIHHLFASVLVYTHINTHIYI
jgi:hypothetical protein